MRRFLRMLLWLLLAPLRLFDYGADIYTLWTLRDTVLTVSVGLAASVGGAILAFSKNYPLLIVGTAWLAAFLFGVWLVATAIALARPRLAQRRSSVGREGLDSATIHIQTAYFGQTPTAQAEAPEETIRIENEGPVFIRQWAPRGINWHGRDVVCLVPYKSYEAEGAFFDAPALRFRVEDIDDVFLVIVDYEVKGENASRPEPDEDLERELQEIRERPPIQLPINIEVVVLAVGEDARVVRELHIHSGEVEELEGGSWRHVVHDNGTISGLPVGEYGINVCDYLDAPFDPTTNERREYRNMRLRVIRRQ